MVTHAETTRRDRRIDMPGYDPFDAGGSNYNLTLDSTNCKLISGIPEHRASLCQVKPVQAAHAKL
jgi:hypothetical protein